MRANHTGSPSHRHGRGMHWRERGLGARVGIVTAGVVAAAGFFVLGGYIVVWLWNWLMPMIFRLPTITFWEAWGLLILASILFKRPFSHANRVRRDQRRRRALRERLQDIADEEEEWGSKSTGDESEEPGGKPKGTPGTSGDRDPGSEGKV